MPYEQLHRLQSSRPLQGLPQGLDDAQSNLHPIIAEFIENDLPKCLIGEDGLQLVGRIGEEFLQNSNHYTPNRPRFPEQLLQDGEKIWVLNALPAIVLTVAYQFLQKEGRRYLYSSVVLGEYSQESGEGVVAYEGILDFGVGLGVVAQRPYHFLDHFDVVQRQLPADLCECHQDGADHCVLLEGFAPADVGERPDETGIAFLVGSGGHEAQQGIDDAVLHADVTVLVAVAHEVGDCPGAFEGDGVLVVFEGGQQEGQGAFPDQLCRLYLAARRQEGEDPQRLQVQLLVPVYVGGQQLYQSPAHVLFQWRVLRGHQTSHAHVPAVLFLDGVTGRGGDEFGQFLDGVLGADEGGQQFSPAGVENAELLLFFLAELEPLELVRH